MEASAKKFLALDTNLILDLAGKKDFAHESKEEKLIRFNWLSCRKLSKSGSFSACRQLTTCRNNTLNRVRDGQLYVLTPQRPRPGPHPASSTFFVSVPPSQQGAGGRASDSKLPEDADVA